jgi:hypothetical protein
MLAIKRVLQAPIKDAYIADFIELRSKRANSIAAIFMNCNNRFLQSKLFI